MSKKKFKASYAIIILLFITIGASLTAFIWLTSVETQVAYKDITIKKIEFNSETQDLNIDLVNGLAVDVPIAEQGKPTEQTVFTIYPVSGEGIGCDFIPLKDLACEGEECNSTFKSGDKVTLSLKGTREKCILNGDKKYHLSIFFGMRAPISKEFEIE